MDPQTVLLALIELVARRLDHVLLTGLAALGAAALAATVALLRCRPVDLPEVLRVLVRLFRRN
ncbi:hypothetical protein BX265_7628 [Streptomyces sp. TLI_235]|nr:hypothetical protein [Streptomyces sp. TLI_235]PBC70232.1 hypothetical protein BX265_7628 [Streptomyces sp. TLI_235]